MTDLTTRFKNQFKDKRLLVLGFAREGIDSLRFLRKFFPKKIIGIADRLEARSLETEAREMIRKEKNIRKHFGPNYLKSIGDYDVIIKAPGISLQTIKPFLRKGKGWGEANQIITSQTEIFFDNCPGKIIGITGTKGKSTTASLIYDVLKAGGFSVYLIGNIGQPVLSFLLKAGPNDIFVYELSSHQLSTLKKSPTVAVFLNIYPEHLDYYLDFKEYLKAKQNICRWQTRSDFFLYNPQNKYVKKASQISKAKKIILDVKKTESFLRKWRIGKSGNAGKGLLGGFNLLNMSAAIEIGRVFNVPEKTIAGAVSAFKPLPHRLEFVAERQAIRFYNDSLATIPEATMAALDALGEEVETIFLGGFDRGLDFRKLARKIIKSNIKNLIFFPTTGERIWKEILAINKTKKGLFNSVFVNAANKEMAMKQAVEFAFKNTSAGKICLLSCASPSFGIFKDYQERGNLFKKFVRDLPLKT